MTSPADPSILFHSENNTAFIIDIPTSIAQAQEFNSIISEPRDGTRSLDSEPGIKKHLLSSPPLESPYPTSCEPKTGAARARLLERVPLSERHFHDEIQPLLRSVLQALQDGYPSARRWCLPRCVCDEEGTRTRKRGLESDHFAPRKRPSGLPIDSSTSKMALNERTFISTRPPVILSSTSINAFESTSKLDGVVKNPSSQSAFLTVNSNDEGIESASEYIVPSGSHFILCTIPLSEQDSLSLESPIPGLSPDQSFNLIVFDPPWPNRSVRRSGHYHTHPYELITQRIRDILHVHAYHQPNTPIDAATIDLSENTHQPSLAAIWTTNSEKSRQTAYEALTSTGFTIYEEWIWIKVTANGQPISPLDGIWRKPYEILVIGRRGTVTEIGACNESRETGCRVDLPKRRVIAAVPDLHSRKPNLKAVFEKIFFTSSRVERYTALEVFARNLTAGWWAVGNEVLKFNARERWVEA